MAGGRHLRGVALFFLVLFAGCAPARKAYLAGSFHSPNLIAVLPINNWSTDLDAPEPVRQALASELEFKGYRVAPFAEMDEKLNENGFTDGGQLGALDGVKLAELLGVDGLLYSELLQFTQINLAFYLERRVEIAARLIDGKSGEKLWSDQQKRSTVIMVTDRKSAERVFAKGMAVRWMEKAIRRPLEPEIEMTVDALFDSLPFNHFQGFYSKEVVP